ncbi:MAG TPA: hypothetical protein VEH06_07890 [Candidatus Bathyarchaeia archaeon]|nr:hypothetical protein [Candidatus Bathyarchaeia archaeon]
MVKVQTRNVGSLGAGETGIFTVPFNDSRPWRIQRQYSLSSEGDSIMTSMIFTYQMITGSDVYHVMSPKIVGIVDLMLALIFIGVGLAP